MVTTAKPLKLKGHKLETYWSGVASRTADGCCECGSWHWRGWTNRMRDVRRSHQGHVRNMIAGTPVPGFDIPYAKKESMK